MSRILKAIIRRISKYTNLFQWGDNKISGIGAYQKFKHIRIMGCNNTIQIKSKYCKNIDINIFGNNHTLIIEEDVNFKSGMVWFEDEGCEIRIGKNTTLENAQLSVAEKNTHLTIGEDCMLSSGIRISTTDSHSIIEITTGERTNHAADIKIGNHVWIGYNSAINKGCKIGNNSVIAGHSVVTKDVLEHTIVAGSPAKLVKDNISWDRNRI